MQAGKRAENGKDPDIHSPVEELGVVTVHCNHSMEGIDANC